MSRYSSPRGSPAHSSSPIAITTSSSSPSGYTSRFVNDTDKVNNIVFQRIDSMYDVRFRDITIDSGSNTRRFSVKDDGAGSDDNVIKLNDVNALNVVNDLRKHIDVVNADVVNKDICKSDIDLNKKMIASLESDDNIKSENEEILDYLTRIVHVHDGLCEPSGRTMQSRLVSGEISEDAQVEVDPLTILQYESDNRDTDDSMIDSGVFIDEDSIEDKANAWGFPPQNENSMSSEISAGTQTSVEVDNDKTTKEGEFLELKEYNRKINNVEKANNLIVPLAYDSAREKSNATNGIRPRTMSAEHLFDDQGWIVTAEDLELPNSNNSIYLTQNSANHTTNTKTIIKDHAEVMIEERNNIGSKFPQHKDRSTLWADEPLKYVDDDMNQQNNCIGQSRKANAPKITNNWMRNNFVTDMDCIVKHSNNGATQVNTANDFKFLAIEMNDKHKYSNIEESKQLTPEKLEEDTLTELMQTTLIDANLTCSGTSDENTWFSSNNECDEVAKACFSIDGGEDSKNDSGIDSFRREKVIHSDKQTNDVGANPIPMQLMTTIFCVSVLCYGVLTNLFLP